MKKILKYLYRLFSGKCVHCGHDEFIEYGYKGFRRCKKCGKNG